jgi:pimeloyl-ACP methyl ester carboxylesterase
MITYLIIGLFLLLFVTAALAPLESLGWWAGWSRDADKKGATGLPELDSDASNADEPALYIIYLSGIGAISGDSFPEEEYPFLHGLEQRLPTAKVITDVYPYSVTNNGLTGQRFFAGIWKQIEKMRLKNPNSVLSLLVNLRNALQMFVSADRRYGPIYNLGIANEIYRVLLTHGYQPKGKRPIVLLGWSGGGQIAIGAANYLAALPSPVYVVSLGGMLSDDPGLEKLTHLWHLYGVADPLQALGGVLYAGRWPLMPNSPWNNAMANGLTDIICLGYYTHNGKGNYFDMETKLPNDARGRSHGEKTIDTVEHILADQKLITRAPVHVVSASSATPVPVITEETPFSRRSAAP